MVRQSLDKSLRVAFAALCLLMLLSLAAQAFNLTATFRESRKVVSLKKKISPSSDAEVKGQDLSAFSELSKAPLFYPAPSTDLPPPQLIGFMGNMALINGKLVAQGDDVDGWKVAELSGDKVVVTHEKQRQELQMQAGAKDLVIDGRREKRDMSMNQREQQQGGGRGAMGRRSMGGGPMGGPTGSRDGEQLSSGPGRSSDQGNPEGAPRTRGPGGGGRFGGGNEIGGGSEEGRAAMQQRMQEFMNSSPEEASRLLKERTGRDVSPEEVQAIRQRMEEFRGRVQQRQE